INPGLAKDLIDQGNAFSTMAKDAETGLTAASEQLRGWSTALGKTNTKVKFQADIADLDAKIAKAQTELKDPNLTKDRKATLKADIAQAMKAKADLIAAYSDPGLVKTRTAKFAADKRDADAKIAANLKALANPALSATKRAHLEAENKQLLQKSREAQAQINSLKGKTVPITVKLTYVGGALKGQNSDPTLGGLFPHKASGGAVLGNRTYLVGEHGPELLRLGSMAGYVTNNRLTQEALSGRNAANSAGGDVSVYVEIDGQQLQGRITKTVRDNNRSLKRNVRQG
ncbi:hypothetical protein, partial [Streptomyces sp. NPDC003952]